MSGLNFLNSLDKSEYNVTVYCNSVHNGMCDLFQKNGYKVISAGKSPIFFPHCSGAEAFIYSPRRVLSCLLRIKHDIPKIENIIKKQNPDIVVLNSMTLFWIARIAKKYNKETILFFRETYVRGIFGLRTSFIKQQLSKYVDKIAFISNFENLQTKNVKCIKKTIYNAIAQVNYDKFSKTECLDKLGLVDNTFNILYVGGMSQLKGAKVAIEALTELKDENIKLVFVGYQWNLKLKKLSDCNTIKSKIKFILNLDYGKACIKLIVKNNLQDRISFYKSQNDIAPFFMACDVLIFPMTRPHQARPLFEAGYAKIPVVITKFNNIMELCSEKSAYFFENKQYKELAIRIKEIIKDPGLAREKCEINYKNTVENHNFENYKIKVNDFLKEE